MLYSIDGHTIEVSQPFGSGGNYHVYVDNYYCGAIILYKDGWEARVRSDVLQGDDIAVLLEMVEEENKKPR